MFVGNKAGLMIYTVALIMFEKQCSETKPSPIYPYLGVYAKVCFAYILVVRQFTKKSLNQTNES